MKTKINIGKDIAKLLAKQAKNIDRASDLADVIGTVGTAAGVGSLVLKGVIVVATKLL